MELMISFLLTGLEYCFSVFLFWSVWKILDVILAIIKRRVMDDKNENVIPMPIILPFQKEKKSETEETEADSDPDIIPFNEPSIIPILSLIHI